MKKILYLSLSLAALSLAAVLSWWLWHVGHQTQSTVASYQHVASGAVTTEKAATEALQQSSETLKAAHEALNVARATIASYEGRSQAWEALAKRESAALRGQIVWAQLMEVRPVQQSLVSTLREHEALTKELRAQVADLYPDVSAAVQSSTVAARGVAEAAEATGKAMPRIAASAEIVASEAAKAAPDARKTIANVERMTRPPGIIVKTLGFFGKLLF